MAGGRVDSDDLRQLLFGAWEVAQGRGGHGDVEARNGFAPGIPYLAEKGQGLIEVMQRLLRVSEAGVDSPEVVEGERLAGFIARGAGALQLLGIGAQILLGVVGGRGR